MTYKGIKKDHKSTSLQDKKFLSVCSSKFKVQSSKFRVQSSEFKVQSSKLKKKRDTTFQQHLSFCYFVNFYYLTTETLLVVIVPLLLITLTKYIPFCKSFTLI